MLQNVRSRLRLYHPKGIFLMHKLLATLFEGSHFKVCIVRPFPFYAATNNVGLEKVYKLQQP